MNETLASITNWSQGLLPMKERREWRILKAAHKAIYSHDWPRNLQLEQVRHARNLQSSSTINLVIPYCSDTFQYSAAALLILCHPMLNVVIILNPSVSICYTRSRCDMANFIRLVPPLFYQVGLWQAINDHGELMVETISNTKLI